MQELNVQPTNPTPYTPAGGTYNNNPVPGAGGLPALSGLSRNVNPMANELQGQGRGEDSVLVHMTPNEVNSLRGLAQKFGGDLTTNPNTGLPEAGFLSKILPTIAGIAGSFVGIPPWVTAAAVGSVTGAVTGDLQKGLMAGLGAYGGASLGSAMQGTGAAVGTTATDAAANVAADTATNAATTAATSAAPTATSGIITDAAGNMMNANISTLAPTDLLAQLPNGVGGGLGQLTTTMTPAGGISTTVANAGANAAKQGAKGILGKFGSDFSTAAREGIKAGTLPYKLAPAAAGIGVLGTASDVFQPEMPTYEKEEDKWKYEGPYLPMPRRYNPRVRGEGEISFFEESNPYPGYLPAGYAEGGETSKGLTLSGVPATPSFQNPAKPISERQAMVEYAGDEGAAKAMSTGWVSPTTGKLTQFSGTTAATMKPGTVQDFSAFGGPTLRLGEDLRWYTAEAPKPTTTTGLPAITPTSTNTTTRVTDTSTPTRNTETVKTTTTEAAKPSGFGVQTLADLYTPQFTQRADYVTPRNAPYTLGSQLTSQMPQFVSQFQTSPGAITASRTYPGGSPSERIRAMAKANAAASPSPMAEMNYGFKSPTTATDTTNPYAPGGYMNNFTNDIVNRYLADYGYAPFDLAAPGGGFGPAVNNAKGGEIRMGDGAFVVDARTVSELGNGSSSAGQELLARLGGRPVKGPGDGVSDSIPANIGGKQKARVARDEVIFPAKAVKRLGGAKKLYALMDKAHKARKKAKRGSDTKLRKGLGAL